MSMDHLEYLQKQREEAKTPEDYTRACKAMDDYWFPSKKKGDTKKARKKARKQILQQNDEWGY